MTQWQLDTDLWEVGLPTSGPNAAHTGQNCAATTLAGNYPETADGRLSQSTAFVVPSASQHPRLRFYHWYSFGAGDTGRVQISVNEGPWQTISPDYVNTSGVWTSPFLDLTTYANQSVQVAFWFKAEDVYWDYDGGPGWYVDDVSVVTGPVVFTNPEGFESGIGNWSAESGEWEVGTPTSGPGSAHAGQRCAGTVLGGNYDEVSDTRLISAPYTVPATSQHPRLRFYHWYSLGPGDTGRVQISVSGGPWQTISPVYVNTSGAWTSPFIDLTTYASQSVRFAFWFKAEDIYWDYDGGPGWYVDDVSVVTGPVVFTNPEGFESGIGNWSAESGEWEVGVPTSGPNSGHNTPNCAGTILGGNYDETANTRLISPPYTVPSLSQHPRLRFYHWYSLGPGDTGRVQISVNGGPWQTISAAYINSSSAWTSPFLDLTTYASQSVRFAFWFKAEDIYGDYDGGPGWYLDDVRVDTGAVVFNSPEGFESGIGNWSVEAGEWEVGIPTGGPGSAHSGQRCAGTVLGGNYDETADTRLISPPFTVSAATQSPALGFWHWYSFGPGDTGRVQISVNEGQWQPISASYAEESGGWCHVYLALSPFASQTVKAAFCFEAKDVNWDYDGGAGWYVDDITVNSYVPPVESVVIVYQAPQSVRLDWKRTQWPNIQYKVYRDSVATGSFLSLIGTTSDSTYVDNTASTPPSKARFYIVRTSVP